MQLLFQRQHSCALLTAALSEPGGAALDNAVQVTYRHNARNVTFLSEQEDNMETGQIIILIVQIILVLLAGAEIYFTRTGPGSRDKKTHRELEEIKTQLRVISEQQSNFSREQAQAQSELRRELNSIISTNMAGMREGIKAQSEANSKAQLSELRLIGDNTVQADKALLRSVSDRSSAELKLIGEMRDSITAKFTDMNESINSRLDTMSSNMSAQQRQSEERLRTLETTTEQKLSEIRKTVSAQLAKMAEDNSRSLIRMTEDNNRQLEKIRGTVDEKLQTALDKKINESFRTVSERLEQVYKGLGEMQNIARGVGDLKNVLSNVKTRGILGEIQLGAILSQILAPEQYEENIATVPKSKERVEFAVKLPGADENSFVYLPRDSKFNGDIYAHLQTAYESGDKDAVAAARKELFAALRKNARDISEKYIYPPATTQFAIMFLPFEGLYAEVVSTDIVTQLQKDYHVNIAGPSTMAAMLNSLQMGFRTLAIQKRSGEVWKILGAVKTEFANFETVLDKTRKHMQSVEKDLDDLVGVRTRQINRKLSRVEMLESPDSTKLLEED